MSKTEFNIQCYFAIFFQNQLQKSIMSEVKKKSSILLRRNSTVLFLQICTMSHFESIVETLILISRMHHCLDT